MWKIGRIPSKYLNSLLCGKILGIIQLYANAHSLSIRVSAEPFCPATTEAPQKTKCFASNSENEEEPGNAVSHNKWPIIAGGGHFRAS